MRVRENKRCKRKKCPYYDLITEKCLQCEWNPDSVWMVRKERR